MSAPMIVEFASGNKIIFARGAAVTGLSEVALFGGVTKATADGLKSALGALGDLVAMTEEKISHMPHRPDKVEMEFRASLSGECDLCIVSGDGEAEFKVTLTWGKEA
jgi:Trypsin-co-occurring domain 1